MKAQHRRSTRRSPAPRSAALVALFPQDLSQRPLTQIAEFVEAELVAQTPDRLLSLPTEVALTVLDSVIDERGRLVPVKAVAVRAMIGEDTAARLHRAQALDALRANAWADNTLKNYGHGVRAWRSWCLERNVPVLPLTPQNVTDHLLDYAFVWDQDAVSVDEAGNPEARVSMGSIEMRLAALNKAAEFLGLPRPGDNDGLRELMRGMRRTLLTAPKNQKHALDHDLLMRCLAAATGSTFATARLRVAILLRLQTRTTAGQLARLHWADLEFDESHIKIELPSNSRGPRAEITLREHPTNEAVCLVRAIRDLRAIAATSPAGLNFVLGHPDGRAMTRQALHIMVQNSLERVGGWDATVSDRDLEMVLATDCPTTTCEATRDRALLLTGFWGALRRSNLTALNWRDLVDHGEDGIEVILRKSKTDQEGRGDSVFAPHGPPTGDIPSPADALRIWRRQLADVLGREPHDREPVFVALTPTGSVKVTRAGTLSRLSGDAINELIQRLTTASGIAPANTAGKQHPFGAHSLRAGFITEGAEQGLSIPDIQSVTKHQSVDVLIRYVRKVDAKKNNAARKLFGQIG